MIRHMTAISLFDVLARQQGGAGAESVETVRLVHFVERLIASALSNLDDLRDYEKELNLSDIGKPELELELRRSVWTLFKEWGTEAERVRDRARALTAANAPVDGLARLNDAIGQVQTRLTVTPEQICRAMEQVRQGEFIPARELRDELNTRLRA
jgi:hypothetical protein